MAVVTVIVIGCSLQACDNGRGAVLLSVARGKVSEGIDFGECFTLSTMFLLLVNVVYFLRHLTIKIPLEQIHLKKRLACFAVCISLRGSQQ